MESQIFRVIICAILFIVQTNSEKSSEIKKCCASGEILMKEFNNTSNFICNHSNIEYVSALKLNKNFDIGIPEICSENETCVDKFVEKRLKYGYKVDLVELQCKNKKSNNIPRIPTIYKCCPTNMIYNDFTKSCDFDEFSTEDIIQDSKADLYNLMIGAPECNKTYFDYFIKGNFTINNGYLNISSSEKGNISFESGEYCIDKSLYRHEVIVRSCEIMNRNINKSVIYVSKCCPHGHMYLDSKKKPDCIPAWDSPFEPFTNSGNPDLMVILPRSSCPLGMYIPNDPYYLFNNGSVTMKTSYFNSLDRKFCTENFNTTLYQGYKILVCFPAPKKDFRNFYYLTALIMSIFFLFITLMIYFFLPKLQNLHGRTVMSHTTSLLAAYIFLTFIKTPTTQYSNQICRLLGYGIMYTFLSAFSWLNVMCFDIWWTFGVVKARGMHDTKGIKKFLLYCLYAHGLPLVITAVAVVIDLHPDVPREWKPNLGGNVCFFELTEGPTLVYTIYFVIPVALIVICNITLFILTARHCFKVRADIHRMQLADCPKKQRFLADKATLIMNLKLFIVMGITWIFELMSIYVREPEYIWAIFDTINALQGLWIFFIFVIKDNVWKALKKKLGYTVIREGSQTQTTSLSAKTSVVSTASAKVNGTKPEEKNLLQRIMQGSPKK